MIDDFWKGKHGLIIIVDNTCLWLNLKLIESIIMFDDFWKGKHVFIWLGILLTQNHRISATFSYQSGWQDNAQEIMQYNSTSWPRQQTGQEHKH